MTGAAQAGGFWRRAAALGLDALWLFCVSGALAFVLLGQPWSGGSGALIHALLPALVGIIGWGRYATTPGKLLLDLRVVAAADGARPGYSRACIRYVGYGVCLLTLGLGFLWAVFDRRKQGLHDKLAGTRVVRVDEDLLDLDPAAVA